MSGFVDRLVKRVVLGACVLAGCVAFAQMAGGPECADGEVRFNRACVAAAQAGR
jgi:hypothetical protein